MAKAVVYLIGEAQQYINSWRSATQATVSSATTMKREYEGLSLSAARSTEKQLQYSAQRVERLRTEIGETKKWAAAYKGSAEQVAIAQAQIARKQAEIDRLTGASLLGGGGGRRGNLRRDEREASGLLRGGLSGSGVGHVGLAALSGGAFFGAFLGTSALKSTITAATDAAAVEKQLAAQYKASGQNLEDYRGQIDKTLNAESALSGFNKDQLTQSFTAIFRASGDTAASLKYVGLAADVARARHMDLQSAALLVSKVINGNVGILKRYGFEVYKGETATEALAAMTAKYAGQAQAGTTAQQRFSAELHNSEVIIGTALLPTVTHLLAEGAHWLDQMNRSGRLQRDVNIAVHDAGVVVGILKSGLHLLTGAVRGADRVTGGFKNTLEILLGLKVGSKLLGWGSDIGLLGGKAKTATGEVETLRGKLATLASLGAIVITIDILERFIPQKATKGGQRILDSEGLGALGHLPLIGPALTAGTYYGRQTGQALGLKYGDGQGNVPGKYNDNGAQEKAYLAGLYGDAPGPVTKIGTLEDPTLTAAYLAGRSARLTKGGGGKTGTTPTRSTGTKPGAIHEFSLPSNLQNALAAAVTPAQDKKAAEDALAYTQKLLNSGRLVGQAYTDALKERKKLYAEIASDSKKLTGGTGGSLLPGSVQADLATAQGRAATRSLPALKALLTEQRSALDTLRSQHEVGKDRVRQVKEEAGLQKQIAATLREIQSVEKQRQQDAQKALQEADARKARGILGLGPHKSLSATDTIKATERGALNQAVAESIFGDKVTKQQLASITRKTSNLGLSGLVELVKKEWGDKLPKTTLDSLEKINKVLALKFLPPDVLANLRARLAQIKQTLTSGLNSISQTSNGYRGVSAQQFVDGIPGLTRAQKKALEQSYSQIEAHGGRPTGPAINGIPTAGGNVIQIDNLTVHGVENLDHLITQIEKRTRHKVQRGGVRR